LLTIQSIQFFNKSASVARNISGKSSENVLKST
jgi:hypothetical protein